VDRFTGSRGAPALSIAAAAWLGGDPETGEPALSSFTPAPDDLLAVLWTSGTGGTPRGVELTRRNLEASARAAAAHLALRPQDRWYAALGLAHVGGLALVTRAAFTGSAVVPRPSFDAGDFLTLAEGGAITHASLVPAMLHRVLELHGERPAPPALRCILVGGAPAPRALVERAVELGFPVALTYGLTEATSQVATAPPDLVRRAVAEGLEFSAPPLPGVELRIFEGEILVRGATVARGFFRHADPTDAGAFPRGEDEWLRTGDRGRLDEEGRLVVSGRISDRIISGGVNVDPVAVEEVVRSHSSIREAAVVGLPDPEWGEKVAVAAVLRPGASLDSDALLDFTRPLLSPAARPRALLVVDALPLNPGGKVDRRRLLALDWPP
jgi:o-succinylbenzoate---CoA ligase